MSQMQRQPGPELGGAERLAQSPFAQAPALGPLTQSPFASPPGQGVANALKDSPFASPPPAALPPLPQPSPAPAPAVTPQQAHAMQEAARRVGVQNPQIQEALQRAASSPMQTLQQAKAVPGAGALAAAGQHALVTGNAYNEQTTGDWQADKLRAAVISRAQNPDRPLLPGTSQGQVNAYQSYFDANRPTSQAQDLARTGGAIPEPPRDPATGLPFIAPLSIDDARMLGPDKYVETLQTQYAQIPNRHLRELAMAYLDANAARLLDVSSQDVAEQLRAAEVERYRQEADAFAQANTPPNPLEAGAIQQGRYLLNQLTGNESAPPSPPERRQATATDALKLYRTQQGRITPDTLTRAPSAAEQAEIDEADRAQAGELPRDRGQTQAFRGQANPDTRAGDLTQEYLDTRGDTRAAARQINIERMQDAREREAQEAFDQMTAGSFSRDNFERVYLTSALEQAGKTAPQDASVYELMQAVSGHYGASLGELADLMDQDKAEARRLIQQGRMETLQREPERADAKGLGRAYYDAAIRSTLSEVAGFQRLAGKLTGDQEMLDRAVISAHAAKDPDFAPGGPEQARLTDLLSGQGDLGDLPEKLAGLAGDQTPIVASTLVPGGAVGRAARALNASRRVQQITGTAAGVSGAYPIEFEHQYQEAYQSLLDQGVDPGIADSAATLEAGGYAVVASALEATPYSKFFAQQMPRAAGRSFFREWARRTARQAAEEGGTEFMQASASQLAGVIAGRTGIEDFQTIDAIEEALAGMIVGGGVGGVTAVGPSAQTTSTANAIEIEKASTDLLESGRLEVDESAGTNIQSESGPLGGLGSPIQVDVGDRPVAQTGGGNSLPVADEGAASTLASDQLAVDAVDGRTDNTDMVVGDGRGNLEAVGDNDVDTQGTNLSGRVGTPGQDRVRQGVSRAEESRALERFAEAVRSQTPEVRVRVRQTGPRSTEEQSVVDIARDLGTHLVLVERTDSPDPLPVTGAIDLENPSIVFLEAGNAARGANAILHHEVLGHSIARTRPDLWQGLQKALQREAPWVLQKAQTRYAAEAASRDIKIDERYLPEEAVGDLALDLASAIYGPATRQSLARIAVSKGPTFVDRVLDYLDGVIRKVLSRPPAKAARAEAKLRRQQYAKATLLFRDALIKTARDEGVLARTARRLMTAEQFPDLYQSTFGGAEDSSGAALDDAPQDPGDVPSPRTPDDEAEQGPQPPETAQDPLSSPVTGSGPAPAPQSPTPDVVAEQETATAAATATAPVPPPAQTQPAPEPEPVVAPTPPTPEPAPELAPNPGGSDLPRTYTRKDIEQAMRDLADAVPSRRESADMIIDGLRDLADDARMNTIEGFGIDQDRYDALSPVEKMNARKAGIGVSDDYGVLVEVLGEQQVDAVLREELGGAKARRAKIAEEVLEGGYNADPSDRVRAMLYPYTQDKSHAWTPMRGAAVTSFTPGTTFKFQGQQMTVDESGGALVAANDDFTIEIPLEGLEVMPVDEGSLVVGDGAFSIASPVDSQAFKDWFGDSVVTVDGKPGSEPLVVYHGSPYEFTAFNPKEAKDGSLGKGFYFSDQSEKAGFYGKNLMPVYLSITNPATLADFNAARGDTKKLIQQGFDGIIHKKRLSGDTEYVAFSPTQIKSATANVGTYDKNNPDIRFSLFDEKQSRLGFDNFTVTGLEGSLSGDLFEAQKKRDTQYVPLTGIPGDQRDLADKIGVTLNDYNLANTLVEGELTPGKVLGVKQYLLGGERPVAVLGVEIKDIREGFKQADRHASQAQREARRPADEPDKDQQALFSIRDPAPPLTRFPRIVTHGRVLDLVNALSDEGMDANDKSTAYNRAKAGDTDAAVDVVLAVIDESTLSEMAARYPGSKVVPVLAEEAAGRNKLPLAYARVIQAQTGLQAVNDIIQTNQTNHTGTGAKHRFMTVPRFEGPVERGATYIVVDDVSASGSSLMALRNYITSKGGEVVAASTLALPGSGGRNNPNRLALSDSVKNAIQKKFAGEDVDAILQEHGRAESLQHLSNGEAAALLGYADADALRAGLASARDGGFGDPDGSFVVRPSGQKRQQVDDEFDFDLGDLGDLPAFSIRQPSYTDIGHGDGSEMWFLSPDGLSVVDGQDTTHYAEPEALDSPVRGRIDHDKRAISVTIGLDPMRWSQREVDRAITSAYRQFAVSHPDYVVHEYGTPSSGNARFSIRQMNDDALLSGIRHPKAAVLPAYGPSVPGDVGFKPGRPAAFVQDRPDPETSAGRKLMKRIRRDPDGNRVGLRSALELLTSALSVKLLYGREQTTRAKPGSYLPEARLLRSRGGNWQADIHNLGYAVFEDAQAKGADWIEALGPKFAEIADLPGSFAPGRHSTEGAAPVDQGFAEWFRRFMWAPRTNPAEVTSRVMAWMDSNLPDHAKAMRDTHRAVAAHLERPAPALAKSHHTDKAGQPTGNRGAFDYMHDVLFRAFSAEAAIDFKVLRPVFKNVKRGKSTQAAQHLMNAVDDTPADVRNAAQWMNALPDELTSALAGDKKLSNRGLRIRQTSEESLGDIVDAIEDEETRQKLIDQFNLKPRDLKNVGFGNVLRLTDFTLRDVIDAVNTDPDTGEFADQWSEFENYGHIKTALDRWEKDQQPYPGLTEGLEPPRLMKMVADFERNNPHYLGQYQRINRYMDRMLLASLVSGEFTPEDLLRIQGKYEAYWPLPRETGLQNDVPGLAGSSDGVNPSSGVMRAYGGAEPFLSIADAVERRTRQALQAYYQNATMRSILHLQEQVRTIEDLSIEHRAEVMQLATPLQLDWKKVATLEPNEKAAAIAEYLNQDSADGDPKDPVRPEEIALLEPGQAIDVWRRESPRAVRVIGVNIGGTRRYYQLADPVLFEYFARTAQPIKVIREIAQFIGAVNRQRQEVLTQNLAFAGRSLFRDMPSAMLFGETKHRFVPLAYLGLGIANRLTKKYPQATEAVGELWSDAQIQAQRRERREARLQWQDVYDRAIEVPGWERMGAGARAGAVVGRVLRTPLSMADVANWLSRGYILPGWANMSIGRQIAAIPLELFRFVMLPANGVNYITGGRLVSNMMERLPREGQAVALLKEGYSPWRARAGAMRVTGNFSARAGSALIQDVHKFALFMNAWAQISYQTMRGLAIEPDPTKKLSNWAAIATAGATIGGVLPAIAYLMMSDEQRKRREEAPDEERLGYLWLPIPGGKGTMFEDQFVRLPHDYGPPGAATSFASYLVEQQIFDQGPNGEQAAYAVIKRSASLPSFFDLLTPDVRTLVELQMNRSFFYGGEIVPAWMGREYQDLPELQAYPDQRGWEKWMARQMGVSPIKLRYALGQHFTRQTLDVMDNVERIANYLRGQPDPNPLDEVRDIPVVGALFAREPRGWSSESVSTLADRETMARGFNTLADSLEEGPYGADPAVAERIEQLRTDASELNGKADETRTAMREIRRLWALLKEERDQAEPDFERIREIERQMKDVGRAAMGLDE